MNREKLDEIVEEAREAGLPGRAARIEKIIKNSGYWAPECARMKAAADLGALCMTERMSQAEGEALFNALVEGL